MKPHILAGLGVSTSFFVHFLWYPTKYHKDNKLCPLRDDVK